MGKLWKRALVLYKINLHIQNIAVLCVLIVEGMSVVVNVMLSLMNVMSPTSCIVQPIGAHCCEVMYFGCVGFRGELGILNCDDVCMVCRE